MGNRVLSDLVGTLKTAFRVGKLTWSAAGLTAARTVTMPDKSGVAAMVSDLLGANDPWTYVTLGSDVTISTTTFGNVTGLSFVADANTTYEVEVFGAFTAAATTTGIGLALDAPSGTPWGLGVHTLTAATVGGFEQVADAATTGATTGVRAATTNVPIWSMFLVPVGVTGGAVQLTMRSEIAASAVVLKAGTILKYRKAVTQTLLTNVIQPITQANYDALPVKNSNTLYVIMASVTTNPNYKWVEITAAAYAALGVKDPETLYVIVG